MKTRFVIILILITAGVYSNTLLNEFVAGDRQFILRNPFVGNFDTVIKSFTSDYWGILGGESFLYFRPLAVLTHFVDFKLYGLNPAGHHLTNIIFHIIVTLLVYRFFSLLFPSKPGAGFAGAVFFALHPIHTHSVSYVMGRTDILAALFYMSGLIFLIEGNRNEQLYKRILKIAGSCLAFFLALLCKEIAITLPAIYLLYIICWPSQNRHKAKEAWLSFCCLCLTALIYLGLRFYAVGFESPGVIPPTWYSAWQKVSLVFITCGFYVWKLVLPFNLCYYSNIIVPGTLADVLSSYLFLTGIFLFIVIIVSLKTAPRLCLALGWIAVTLTPVLNIIPLPALAKENYLYIPSIGFCLFFSMLTASWSEKKNFQGYCTIIFFISLIYGAGTLKRNNEYRTPVIFLKSTISAMDPVPSGQREDVRFFEGVKNFYTTYRNLGRLYMEQGLWGKASREFEKALSYTPLYFSPEYTADIKISLGKAYEKTGELDKAVRVLNSVLPASSRQHYVYNLLGVVFIKLNEEKRAEASFKQAIKSKDDYAPAHYNLGKLYIRLKRKEEGYYELGRAAELNPKYRKFILHNP